MRIGGQWKVWRLSDIGDRRRRHRVGCRGCLANGLIPGAVFESASGGALFTLIAATIGGAVPVWLRQFRHPASGTCQPDGRMCRARARRAASSTSR